MKTNKTFRQLAAVALAAMMMPLTSCDTVEDKLDDIGDGISDVVDDITDFDFLPSCSRNESVEDTATAAATDAEGAITEVEVVETVEAVNDKEPDYTGPFSIKGKLNDKIDFEMKLNILPTGTVEGSYFYTKNFKRSSGLMSISGTIDFSNHTFNFIEYIDDPNKPTGRWTGSVYLDEDTYDFKGTMTNSNDKEFSCSMWGVFY